MIAVIERGKMEITRIVVLCLMLLLISACDKANNQPSEDIYPWQIILLSDGKTRVFGITLSESTLNDAVTVLGRNYKLGLFETPDQPLSLEIYFNEVTLGGISGKFVLTL